VNAGGGCYARLSLSDQYQAINGGPRGGGVAAVKMNNRDAAGGGGKVRKVGAGETAPNAMESSVGLLVTQKEQQS